MKPRCSRCGETDPSPMRDPDGDLVYWFRVEEDEDGEEHLCSDQSEDSDGEPTVAFTGMTTKDFEYDGTFKVVCPECACEECEYIKGDLVEDDGLDDEGWMADGTDPFDSGLDEDNADDEF